jgi:hypothetical protein
MLTLWFLEALRPHQRGGSCVTSTRSLQCSMQQPLQLDMTASNRPIELWRIVANSASTSQARRLPFQNIFAHGFPLLIAFSKVSFRYFIMFFSQFIKRAFLFFHILRAFARKSSFTAPVQKP